MKLVTLMDFFRNCNPMPLPIRVKLSTLRRQPRLAAKAYSPMRKHGVNKFMYRAAVVAAESIEDFCRRYRGSMLVLTHHRLTHVGLYASAAIRG